MNQMLDLILRKRFELQVGHTMVCEGHYAIEDGNDGHEIARNTDLLSCLRPGQKVDMSMVFDELHWDSNTCPRCRTKVTGSTDSRIQWYDDLYTSTLIYTHF